nr:hypothetical protein [uncultured bacterium]
MGYNQLMALRDIFRPAPIESIQSPSLVASIPNDRQQYCLGSKGIEIDQGDHPLYVHPGVLRRGAIVVELPPGYNGETPVRIKEIDFFSGDHNRNAVVVKGPIIVERARALHPQTFKRSGEAQIETFLPK